MQSRETVKFLLVDDHEENLLALEALLRRDGLEMIKARSGREALELLLAHDVALVLIDVQMPEMDGFELAELMRGAERTRRVPIIFLTAVATDERRRFRGYESGAVDYLLKPLDTQMLRNKAEVFYELARQRQELARQRDDLRESAEQLSRALGRLQAHGDNSPLAIVEFDPDFRLASWSKGAERMFGWRAEEVLEREMAALGWLHEEDEESFTGLCAELLAGRRARCMHTQRNHCKDGSVVDCEWYVSALVDSAGNLTSVNAAILDVTERRRAEETQLLLMGELSHRVKNTLATVQAIASQSLRHARDPASFAHDFSGRLEALARAHSLLSNATWRGAELSEVVRDQLRLGAIEEARLVVSGPEVHLPPQLALHLALILHELTTNAHKYGALSKSAGRVELGWEYADGLLRLRWVEHGGEAVTEASTRRGFGTSLIERSARAEGGSAEATYGPDGIAWEMTFSFSHQNAYTTRPGGDGGPPPRQAAAGTSREKRSEGSFRETGPGTQSHA